MNAITWDYTKLASSYNSRPDYAQDAIGHLLHLAGVQRGDRCCDIGAGTGHLTRFLLSAGLEVDAVEPNDAMREIGQRVTAGAPNVRWFAATAEQSGRPDATYHLVTFGSSFNVTDRPRALRETARILRPQGWFACMWNHRDLDDPLQAAVEAAIRSEVPEYAYGTRREDQTAVIQQSGLFTTPVFFEASVRQQVRVADWLEAWNSHATLQRQAGDRLPRAIDAIRAVLGSQHQETLEVPYITRVWAAQLLNQPL